MSLSAVTFSNPAPTIRSKSSRLWDWQRVKRIFNSKGSNQTNVLCKYRKVPNETLKKIFLYLKGSNVIHAQMTCRQWNEIVKNSSSISKQLVKTRDLSFFETLKPCNRGNKRKWHEALSILKATGTHTHNKTNAHKKIKAVKEDQIFFRQYIFYLS